MEDHMSLDCEQTNGEGAAYFLPWEDMGTVLVNYKLPSFCWSKKLNITYKTDPPPRFFSLNEQNSNEIYKSLWIAIPNLR
jgi:hypothetical protein